MASSSSSSCLSHSNAATSSQLWNYDVFLSFRGEDTRKTFVDHLYSALDQNGIHTYKDDEALPRGESIGPSLLKAIEESRISIIVFSKNYANSSWCLDELSYIMKCKDERGQIVLPIFYDVDPSDVRKQKQKFGEAFSKHELENNTRVESWKKALFDAANLSGWEPKNVANGHESKFIKEMVDTVLGTLRPLTSTANANLIGIETRMQHLISRLDIGSGGVRMVGIWGVGGGGKTTLAFSVYNKISCEFDGCSFIENVRTESSMYGLKKLQEKIVLDILKRKGIDVGSVEEGKYMIKSRLCHKSVLIVLDDVDQCDQLEALAGSHDWFGMGSRIIITTRDVNLLEAHRVNTIHNVSLLTHDEATQLFSRHAFGESMLLEGYEKLSINVVSRFGGIPLALKIMGSFLCGKDMKEWNSALARLTHIPNGKILEKLKISYDGLESLEKELFLDIACFYRRENANSTMTILDACGLHPIIGVKVLIQKALITISNGMFDMHDLVQEMGHYIVRGEHSNNPENHSRVWRDADVRTICDRNTTTENHKTEALKIDCLNDPPHFLQVITNMKKLRLLNVHKYEPNYTKHRLQLVEPPKLFSNELRWICWDDYPARSFPENFKATMLGGLILKNGLQKQLWTGEKHLPHLKVLDLCFSKNLIRTPDFDGLLNLERLVLCDCFSLIEIHESIGRLEKLIYLNLRDCHKLEMFPPIVHMKKLETFILSYCYRLQKFPEIQMKMDSLEHLDLRGSGIEVVPSSVGKYCTNLVSLNLDDCKNLKSIEGNFCLLKHLKGLHLNFCTKLEKLPEELFDVECCLKELSLPPKWHWHSPSSQHLIINPFRKWLQCHREQMVVLEYPRLPHSLRKLDLNNCRLENGDIPSEIYELSNLQVLCLRGNNFSRLHSSLSQLPQLKVLNLENCINLIELPKLPSSIAVLIANNCESLEIAGDFPTNYKRLWKVSFLMVNGKPMIDGDILLQSMLQQGNAMENQFLSLCLQGHEIPKLFVDWLVKGNIFTLHLPHNWYNQFTGFLMCVATRTSFSIVPPIAITMKQATTIDSQFEPWKELEEAIESYHEPITYIGYFSFSSLAHTTWWKSTCNTILFNFQEMFKFGLEVGVIPEFGTGVGVIPWKNEGDPTHCFEVWDEEIGNEEFEDRKTFEIKHDSKSTLEIHWHHRHWSTYR